MGFNFRDFTFFPVSWKTSDVRIQKKIKLYFLGYAEQLRAASQYSLVSIERSFFCYVAVFRRRGREKTFVINLSFGIFFLSFSSKFRAINFLYIVQRRCRNSKSKRRGFLFNFCFPVFVFTVFCFFLSHHQLERSLILVLWSLTKKIRETTKPFVYNCKGGRA